MLAACVALALAAGAAAAADRQAPSDELKATRARLEALRKEFARTEGDRREAADALRESEQAISEASRRLFDLAADKRTADARLGQLRERIQAAETGIARQQAQLAKLVRHAYMGHPAPVPGILLAGGDPNETARMAVYHGYVARARTAMVERLRADQASLAALAAEALQRTTELAAIESEQLAQRRVLEVEKEKRQAVLASLAKRIDDSRRQIATLAQDEQRLVRLIESLARIVAPRKPPPPARPATPGAPERVPEQAQDGTPFQQLKGRLQLPVRGELAGRFGTPRSDSGLSWKGLFIQAANGLEVRAVAGGQVVFADWMRGFGNLLIIDHGEGYMSLYGNNESLVRRAGDRVRPGDTVATVGASGGNAQSGLYFELRHQGRPFDPLGWITGR